MAAYGAITSLLHILEQSLKSDHPTWITSSERESIQSLNEKLGFLQNFLEKSANTNNHDNADMKSLEGQLRDAVVETEDVIESHMVDCHFAEIGTLHLKDPVGFHQRLKLLDERIDSLRRKMKDEVQKMEDSFKDEPVPKLSSSAEGRSYSFPALQADSVVGFDQELEILKSRIFAKSSELQVVSIVGIGGIGKTTLARTLYNDKTVLGHCDAWAWTTVSQNYDLKEVMLGLLQTLTRDDVRGMDRGQVAEKLQRCLKGPRYLIVLDDLWSEDTWYDLMTCFPDYNNGSRIVVTTRNSDVARQISNGISPHSLTLLHASESWFLLFKKVFVHDTCPPELEKIGRNIAERCRGLRLLIVVIAGLLSRINRTEEEWKKVEESLRSVAQIGTEAEQCMEILALSYKNLPHHLKACFLYMGAFPEDHEIPVRKLVRLWVAEGFLKGVSDKSLEVVAEQNLEDLIGRNLILIERKNVEGSVKSCKVHDLLHDFCLREAEKENFLQVVSNSVDLPSGSTNCPRRIVVSSTASRQEDDNLPVVPLKFTRSVLHQSTYIPTLSPEDVDERLRLLRVLDVRPSARPHDLCMNEIIPKLVLLRYIALTFERLPASISNLCNLQTLVADHRFSSSVTSIISVIARLPPQIWEISGLRHIHFTNSFSFSPPPLHINGDRSWMLRDLKTIDGLAAFSCSEDIFKRTPNITYLSIHHKECMMMSFLTCQHMPTCLRSLSSLDKLETLKLKLVFAKVSERPCLPPTDAFPPNLRKLSLSGSKLPWDDMRILSMLPNLQVLKLKARAFQGSDWEPTSGGFVQLKLLLLQRLDLVHWRDAEDPFPRLQCLILKQCFKLAEIPESIGEIETLQRIELHACEDSIVASAVKIQEYQLDMGNDGFEVLVTK